MRWKLSPSGSGRQTLIGADRIEVAPALDDGPVTVDRRGSA